MVTLIGLRNKGAGYCRDIGISISEGDLIIFIDSDIIMPKSFIANHVFAHSTLNEESFILVNFREDVSLDDTRLLQLDFDVDISKTDHRVNMTFKKEWVVEPQDKKLVDRNFQLLLQTNNFKEFGNGKKIEIWSLPMMVLTCAMSVSKKWVDKVGKSPLQLKGWGFNDTCMAAKLIGLGLKVVPNFNSSVLHILENKHTKNTEVKNREYLNNKIVYEKVLNATFT